MLRNLIIMFLCIISLSAYSLSAYAQDKMETSGKYTQQTIEVSEKYTPDVVIKYHVLKYNGNVKEGLFQAFYRKRALIASGYYTNGKKTGIWHFYNNGGQLVQRYNYDKNLLMFVTSEDTSHNIAMYEFVPKPADTAWATPPIRIGGLLYGYLPYLKKFKIKDRGYDFSTVYGILQILVSPYGQLADCKLDIKRESYYNTQIIDSTVETYTLNNELLDDEDKRFLPATVSHNNVSTTIYIYCKISPNGTLSIY